jgi:hypothetical protein
MLPNMKERLLANVLGNIRIANYSAGYRQSGSHVPVDELTKCGVVSGTGGSYERGISARFRMLRLSLRM